MKSKIEFAKADESSFDGTAADIYSADEAALFSQHSQIVRLRSMIENGYGRTGKPQSDFHCTKAYEIK